MDDTPFSPSGPLPSMGASDSRWHAKLSHWVSKVLGLHQSWLRDLPAGRGPHTQPEEQWFAQAVGRLHQGVASQLAEGRQRIDLHEFGDVLNRMPGAGVSALYHCVTDHRIGNATIEWPSDFRAFGRGPCSLFLRSLTGSSLVPDGADQDEGSLESDEPDESCDTDSENEEERFQSLGVDDRRRLYVSWACDQWHSENAELLQDWTCLTNRQWLQVQQVLEQVRLQAVEASLTVRLAVQWPPTMHLSFDRRLRRIEEFMRLHQLGPCSIQWQMVDPLVPDSLRSPPVYLAQCRFKESLRCLHLRARRLGASLMNTWPARMRLENLSPDAQAAQRLHLLQAMNRLEEAVKGLHDGMPRVVDLTDAPVCSWHKDLLAALVHWRADPVLGPAALRLEITLADH